MLSQIRDKDPEQPVGDGGGQTVCYATASQ